MKKIPMRMCVVTREKYPKQELLRIVKNEGHLEVDPTGKMNGKGAYIKKDIEVLNKAQKTKILNKVFQMEIPEEIYEEIKKYL